MRNICYNIIKIREGKPNKPDRRNIMTNAMINKAKKAIKEAKERCSFAYETGFRHYGYNYRIIKDTDSSSWKIFRHSETDIHDTFIGEIIVYED